VNTASELMGNVAWYNFGTRTTTNQQKILAISDMNGSAYACEFMIKAKLAIQ
jgi:TRAP-type C4-dicarboxylate transport system substrate-binding protein